MFENKKKCNVCPYKIRNRNKKPITIHMYENKP